MPVQSFHSTNVVLTLDVTKVCDHSNDSYLKGRLCDAAVVFPALCKVKFGYFCFILNLACAGGDRLVNLHRVTVRVSKRHRIS